MPCKLLKSIRIERAAINDEGVAAIARLSQLERLDLVGNSDVTDACLPVIAKSLNLIELRLGHTQITLSGLAALQHSKSLIALGYLLPEDPDIAANAKQLALTFPKLEALFIDGVTDNTGRSSLGPEFIEPLRAFHGLKHLSFSSLDLRPGTLEAISKMASLEQLDFLYGVQFPAAELKSFSNLRNLKFISFIGSRANDDSAKALPNVKSLRDIRFGNTAVTEEGAAALEQAIPGCKVTR